jgi:hypothetical protein
MKNSIFISERNVHFRKKRSVQKTAGLVVLSLSLAIPSQSWAATDPFVGTWKLNPSKSKLTDQMKVESLGGNKYAFDFGGGQPVTVVADGTDQPGNFGLSLAVAVEGPHTWKVVRKKDGRLVIEATWELSTDGNTLTDHYTGYQPNGSKFRLDYVYKRTEGTSGFAGTWESTSEKVNSAFEIAIRPYEDNGLSFVNPAQESTQNMEFDGKDYPNQGPNVAAGSASSGHRVNESTLAITDKMNDKITDTRELKLSPDLKTLTITVQPVSRKTPNILVFDRE